MKKNQAHGPNRWRYSFDDENALTISAGLDHSS